MTISELSERLFLLSSTLSTRSSWRGLVLLLLLLPLLVDSTVSGKNEPMSSLTPSGTSESLGTYNDKLCPPWSIEIHRKFVPRKALSRRARHILFLHLTPRYLLLFFLRPTPLLLSVCLVHLLGHALTTVRFADF